MIRKEGEREVTADIVRERVTVLSAHRRGLPGGGWSPHSASVWLCRGRGRGSSARPCGSVSTVPCR